SQHPGSTRLPRRWASESLSCTAVRSRGGGICLRLRVHAITKVQTRRSTLYVPLSRHYPRRHGGFGVERGSSSTLGTSCGRPSVIHVSRLDQILWSGLPDLAEHWP